MKKDMNVRPVVGLLLVVLLAIFVIETSHPAHASTTANPVFTVGNTAANPVPTSAQGTTAISGNVGITGTPIVNVANVPAVQSQQSGPWTVGVNGTPTVNVASLPAVTLSGTPNVNIAGGSINTAVQPATATLAPGAIYDLPAGQELCLRFISTGQATSVSTIVLDTKNDLRVSLATVLTDTTAAKVNFGTFPGGGGARLLNFGQPIQAQGMCFNNDALLTTATFSFAAFGN